jgi:uncharacterized protein YjbJ (UPF0337 family)
MRWERIQGDWQRFETLVRQRWSELSKREVAEIDGSRERLAERLAERYGLDEDEVERQIREFQWSCQPEDCAG